MLLSPLDGVELVPEYPELAGRRVLVTGVGGALGLDIVQLLAEQRAHIALAAATDTPETQALAEMIAPIAGEVHLFTGPFGDHDSMIRLARNAVQSLGGVDAVINLAEVCEPVGQATESDVEQMVTSLLALPCLVTRVAANRMRTMLTQGTIINIVTTAPRASARALLVARIARSALASFTRNEAKELAAQGIHINAIAPSTTGAGMAGLLSGNPDIASLAMHIASGRGSNLSGLVFEATAG